MSKDPHPGEMVEEEQDGAPHQLSRLHLYDWTTLQAAVKKTNQDNEDLGKSFSFTHDFL